MNECFKMSQVLHPSNPPTLIILCFMSLYNNIMDWIDHTIMKLNEKKYNIFFSNLF
jgi:hypothetical protein